MMKKDVRHDLIERYLDGSLPATERQEMESRLAADPALRSELELHRRLQKHLGDPGEVRLRTALDDLLYTPPPTGTSSVRPQNPGWLRLAAWMALLAVAGLIAWYWWSADNGKPAPAPVKEQPQEAAPSPSQTLPPAPVPPSPTQTPDRKEGSKQPIAMANPVDFRPNPDLDARIGGLRGGAGDANLDLFSPTPDAEFRLINGRITLRVRGTMTTDSLP
ncbi:MAG: hypothetical protein ABIQ93_14250, partial [Saprospiraceae bacterium]